MIAFMTIIYVAAVLLVFKVFKVQPRPWPIAITATAGVLLLGTIIVLWTLAAPISSRCVVTRYVVQIVPQARGQVIRIPAKPNVPLKSGDVLYELDPTSFQADVDRARAQLQGAKSQVREAEAGVRVAQANIKSAEAGVAAKKADFEVAVAIQKENPQAIAKLKLVEAEQSYAAAEAELSEATASLEEAQSAVVTANDNVDAASAQLVIAQQNLEDCTITAPADGFVTDWAIRVGSYVVPMPMSASGTFIDTSDTWIAASFPEQMLIHVELGQEVELAFKSNPGRLFRGRVDEIVEATGEGQFVPTGKLPSAASIGSPGYLAVKVRLHDPEAAEKLALGTAGTIAIYTNWGKPFAVISKVAIRMKKWLYFLPLPSRQ